ncbi:SusC/RagA family TonB-linked outer membrane protein [Tenacibaculum tangerinum]|uniref:SusC/RagA family TonB-linked outer membrane protein n=1 Tax=Tenacibaculum tangerinum TaxID=3038772 RepID=A0ABY8L493_9FLAO|nr:SusC/RagA family TonB-linked outer membrane protein [Tenacibaculum tangerinum]WGH75422.1 SusC/RagA family TonB-linked outer membrane protein [Tenacibaculum tangerinum]
MRTKFNGILTLFLALVVQISFAQEKTISGTVSDQSGPLPGVTILKKGTTQGTETDFDGNYTIQAKTGDVLVFSFVGMKSTERTVGSSNQMNVVLETDNLLEEVVVVGYGTTTKKAYAGTASVVKAENIEAKSFSNVSQALIGEVAGVNVINTSGQPGTVGTVRIRGYGSVNGNRNPLYVVDGVPYGNSLNSINPADIESTTILKDATATAIYGSRGANGVVLITTKKGSKSNSYIEVDVKTGVNDQLIPRYDVITSPEEYIGYVWEGIKNKAAIDGRPDPIGFANDNLFTGNYVAPGYNMWNVTSGADLIDPQTSEVLPGVTRKYTPKRYADLAFNPAIRTEANARFGGGSENTTYFASFGYLDDNGYALNTGFQRYSTRLNLTTDIKPWLKVSSNIGYNFSERLANGQIVGSENVFEFADKMAPIFPVFLRDDNGQLVPDPFYGGYQYDYGSLSGFRDRPNANGLNPIGSANYDVNRRNAHAIDGNFSFEIKFTDYLKAEVRYGAQYTTRQNKNYTNKFYGGGQSTGGDLFVTDETFLTQNFLQLLRFNKNWSNHSLEVLAAHESTEYTATDATQWKGLQVSPFNLDLNNFQSELALPTGFREGYTIESYFAQANYNYMQKYFLTGSVRTDGSSRFLKDKWGVFGSVGAAWILSNENFLSNNNLFRFLKLKASYGVTGDQAGVGFYSGADDFILGNLSGNISISPDGNGNADLTWETSRQFQVGTEFTLGNFLDGTVDYYQKRTDNLIFDRRVGPSQGIAIITVNDGELLNAGLEFQLTGHLIKKERFALDLSVNGEVASNEITRMPVDPATGAEKYLDNSNGNYGYSVGRSIYDFYMREWAGVDPADGAPMWYQYYDDKNDNGVLDAGEAGFAIPDDNGNNTNQTGSIVEYEQRVPDANIKKAVTKTYSNATEVYANKSLIPDVRGAFRLAARLGDFNLSSQFTYSLGGYAYDGQYAELMADRFGAVGNNFHKDIVNRWRNPGDITDVPRLADGTDQNSTSGSTRFLTSTDYLALNNISLGYTIPARFIENSGVDMVNISLTGDNLYMNTAREGFLPNTRESGNSGRRLYAPMSTLTLGVRVKF